MSQKELHRLEHIRQVRRGSLTVVRPLSRDPDHQGKLIAVAGQELKPGLRFKLYYGTGH